MIKPLLQNIMAAIWPVGQLVLSDSEVFKIETTTTPKTQSRSKLRDIRPKGNKNRRINPLLH